MYNLSNLKEFDHHKLLVDLSNGEKGLQGYIAIHNDNLGPALGGTRVFQYKNKQQALSDVLRLSAAMTYKCAIAGLPFGGGKGVIIADPKQDIRKLLKSYALKVLELKGRFYTGEDVGLSQEDVQFMSEFSPYFIGKKDQAGDPSPYAAASAFLSIKVALKFLFNNDTIAGHSFAIQGMGKTGGELARLLVENSAKVFIADIDNDKTKTFARLHKGLKVVEVSAIDKLPVDVFCPCSLGSEVNSRNIGKIKAKIICGTANNQLESLRTAAELYKIGILHVPDYIANAGGLINVADELMPGGYNKARVLKGIDNLKKTLQKVLQLSKSRKTNPDWIANEMAERVFLAHKKVKQTVTAAKINE